MTRGIIKIDLDECKRCRYHLLRLADEILCNFSGRLEHRIMYTEMESNCKFVIDCPMKKNNS